MIARTMRFTILAPYNAQTGGPEALHQLAHKLSKLKLDVGIWYYDDKAIDDVKKLTASGQLRLGSVLRLAPRANPVAAYGKYDAKALEVIHFDEETVFVVPEVLLDLAPFLSSFKVVFWWLSFDVALWRIGNTNLNYLRFGRFIHAGQSTYACRVCDALGLPKVMPLSDYSARPDRAVDRATKTDSVVINATPHKVIFNVPRILEAISAGGRVRVVTAHGLPQEAIYRALEESKAYLELGNLQGKDRMPREALARQCLVYSLRVGAWEDLRLPASHLLDYRDVPQLSALMMRACTDYNSLVDGLEPARAAVAGEEARFEREVAALASAAASL